MHLSGLTIFFVQNIDDEIEIVVEKKVNQREKEWGKCLKEKLMFTIREIENHRSKSGNDANLAMLEPYSHDVSCTSNLPEVSQQDCLGHSPNHGLNKSNDSVLVNERYKEKFVGPSVVNLSRRKLTSNEVSLFPGYLNVFLLPGVLIK